MMQFFEFISLLKVGLGDKFILLVFLSPLWQGFGGDKTHYFLHLSLLKTPRVEINHIFSYIYLHKNRLRVEIK